MWFTLLAAMSGLALIYRLVVLLSAKFRSLLFRLRFQQLFQRKQRSKLAATNEDDAIEIVSQHCRIGDWFLLSLISENVNVWVFRDIVERLAVRIKQREKSSHLFISPPVVSDTKPV